MLAIVIAKPIQVTSVIDVPLISGGADCATSAENSGESATTVIPQNSINKINSSPECSEMASGDNRQQQPDNASAYAAVRLLPYRFAMNPASAHATLPMPMIIKA